MQILRAEHTDFSLSVECVSINETFARAIQKQPGLLHSTCYDFHSATGEVWLPLQGQWIPVGSELIHPVFFENKEYFFWIEFKDLHAVRDVRVHSRLKSIEDKFHFRKQSGVLAGTINFRNDIGKSELIIEYLKNGILQRAAVGFEVFPVKLDYRSDYLNLLSEIEEKYSLLVLDFLRKTFSTFRQGNTDNTDLVWWQIFGGIYSEFIQASRFILQRPRIRLQKETRFVRADRLIYLNASLEEEFVRFKDHPEHNYRIAYPRSTTDTQENRFFKFVVRKTESRFARVNELIRKKYKAEISEGFDRELKEIEKSLRTIKNNPFFRSVGEYAGLRQESLVLQRASGYSTIYKNWIMLNSGISFLEGIQKLELKNIAELYQIWCFLEMKEILTSLIGRDPAEVSLAQLKVDSFVFEFRTGQKSRVSFLTPSGDEVVLFHDYQFGKDQGQTRSYTVAQRPDIVLQITRNDLRDKYTLTYLYDAKYRLQSDDDVAQPDLPPDDAINQMHRYRDAIYYADKQSPRPQKEVIGAYVLFPGAGDHETVRQLPYSLSIRNVNIGAFPLRPGANECSILLEEHLQEILDSGTENILRDVIPQKGSLYEPVNPAVLIGVVRKGLQTQYFESENQLLYHTGSFSEDKLEEFLVISNELKYFAPYFGGRGVNSYYEILNVSVKKRCDIFSEDDLLFKGNDLTERIVFHLGRKTMIKDGNWYKAKIRNYGYSDLKNIRNPVQGEIIVLDKQALFWGL